MSVAVIAAYLAFFPVAVGGLRGLQSPLPESVELMDSYAAGWWTTLVKLRLPSAVPYLVPALKLAAAASVVGAVVAEISTGTKGGIGRLIIEYSREATSDPAKVYTAMLGAAALGLAVAGLVALIDLAFMRNRPPQETRGVSTAVAVAGRRQDLQPGQGHQVDALRGIDLVVETGEFVSLIGPSGCGKSTLLRLVANLTDPTAGTVLVNQKRPARPGSTRTTAWPSRQAGLFEWRTVAKNIELPLELQGVDRRRRRARAVELLELVKLPEFADHHPWELSGGMQQRVAIARALAGRPASSSWTSRSAPSTR